jgi:hypothetical protein
MENKKAVIVYQAGIANVFEVECFNMAPYGREAVHIMQSDFRSCESYARGLKHAGYTVAVASCNKAGDVAHQTWIAGLDDCPFRDEARAGNFDII